ncbi:MAG: hypothetical protein SFU86_22745 [Pirellulaceae bacterium]|nr:hypothetical protein [Pirellulaceae bacterium]
MRRWFLAGTAAVGLSLAAVSAHGGGWENFWHRVHTDFHRNNAWPEPFESTDRASVREPFCIQTDNGWKMQNTVGTYLFNPETHHLNQAGDLLVKWILTQAPVHRRAVFVLKADTAEHTAARVASVQAAVAKYACGPIPPIMLTETEPAGWSASYIDAITQQFQSTIPAPRLPAPTSSPTAGDSSGGASGS